MAFTRRSISERKLGENGQGRTSNQACKQARELNVHVKVQFVGESAIEGGPRCELFCLVDHMVSNELMQGEEGQKTFLHNMVLLQKNEYHLYGQ